MSNVVVVGAGLAGLAAARRLAARGHDVIAVEARERVGGRTEGLVLDDGTPLDLGCAPPSNGYMEGAVRSGEATAEAVAALAMVTGR